MTITRAFGFTFDPRTGGVERWAAGDPASVVEHLDAARERMRAANVPTLAQIREKLGPLADVEVLGIVTGRPPEMLQDQSKDLTAWLAGKPDAMRHARDAAAKIRAGKA